MLRPFAGAAPKLKLSLLLPEVPTSPAAAALAGVAAEQARFVKFGGIGQGGEFVFRD